jgi:hypothetical protein
MRVIEPKNISNRRIGGQRDAKFQRSFANRAVGVGSEGLGGIGQQGNVPTIVTKPHGDI